MSGRPRPLLVATLLVCWSCEDEAPPPAATNNDIDRTCANASKTVEVEEEEAPEVSCPDVERTLLCFGSWAAHCNADGKLVDLTNCRASDQVCVDHKCADAESCTGCRSCQPGNVICGEDGARRRCLDDGSGYEPDEPCDETAGLRCNVVSGQCEDLCALAAEERSYIGCEYWAVNTSNSPLHLNPGADNTICDPFPFAVVIDNPQGIEARITIVSPGGETARHTVESFGVKSIELPCVKALKSGLLIEPEDVDAGVSDESFFLDGQSVVLEDAAHRIRSDVPITVYQFNPLEFRSTDADGDEIYSFTNDASLLLPTHALTDSYRVMTRPTLLHRVELTDERGEGESFMNSPGFVAVVGIEEKPTEVTITSSAYTRPTADGAIGAMAPGDTVTVTLGRGDVLQLLSAAGEECRGDAADTFPGGTLTYCKVGADYDLTGTQIKASARVNVIGGHDCAFLPYNRWACDHLEETMFPLEAWGKEIFVSISETVNCLERAPNLIRVLSDEDDNRVRFSPEVHDEVVLDAGEFVEFQSDQDVHVSASKAILVGQFLLGQDYEGGDSSTSLYKGDPAFSLGIPVEQWRTRYAFLTPATFTDNYVNVTARDGQVVTLDGRIISGFEPIEGTNMATARVSVEGGHHTIESDALVGIVVYGYAVYTSYMVPGGLDLNPINRPE